MARAVIHLDALVQNYRQLKSLAPDSNAIAVIKADAYGHGLLEVAEALSQYADAFAVARLEEALKLRDAGLENDILLLEGFSNERELQSAISHQFKTVLHDESQITLLQSIGSQHNLPLSVWVKVNTGMNRLGFSLDTLEQNLEAIKDFSWLKFETLMTHFANADSGKHNDIKTPMALFKQAKEITNKHLPDIAQYSIANSAALIAYPETHANWNRPGISLFGGSTLPDKQKNKAIELLPVMTLSAPVIAIHSVKKGESVGYGATWTSEKDSVFAVIAIGYGDGYPRHAKNGTPVSINGTQFPLAGRVSMDMITVNLGENTEQIQVGDTAVLWGRVDESCESGQSDESGITSYTVLSADTIAKFADTISYELFCRLTPRVGKEYQLDENTTNNGITK